MPLTEDEEIEYLRLLEEEQKFQAENRLYSLYPDTGPLRRELYRKHLQHFAAGRQHQERALMGGNRCLTLATPIETDIGERRLEEIACGQDFGVVAWADGGRQNARARPVFPKGIEPAFRLRLDNGEVVECSGRHQLLTVEGWISLARIIRLADGIRSIREVRDYPASCDTGNYPGGLAPLWGEGSGQEPLPSRADARLGAHLPGNMDEAGHIGARSRVCRARARQSSWDDLGPIEALSVPKRGERQSALLSVPFVQWWSETLQGLQQSAVASGRWRSLPGLSRETQAYLAPCGGGKGCRAAGGMSRPPPWTVQDDWRSAASSAFESGVLEWLHGALGTAIFYPSAHKRLIGGNRIVSVEGIGFQLICDFEVPGVHNYMAGGLVHHNSGKSMACTYEHVCHLIDWYPPWWQGFVFHRSIVGWAAGEDTKAVRESLQVLFLGPPEAIGTGLIPKNLIQKVTARSGVPDAVDAIQVRSSRGSSRLLFKSYDQGRESFQAAKVDVMQFDEEPPQSVYSEGLTRTMATVPGDPNGLVICGFTPLRGLSGVVLSYMPGGERVEGEVSLHP